MLNCREECNTIHHYDSWSESCQMVCQRTGRTDACQMAHACHVVDFICKFALHHCFMMPEFLLLQVVCISLCVAFICVVALQTVCNCFELFVFLLRACD